MGSLRLLLAALVVLFHFGGMSPLTGRGAVFGFYCLSGYLMLLVLDRVYSRGRFGTLKFYANRVLRIYPLYLVFVVATYLVVRMHHGPLVTVTDGSPRVAVLGSDALHYGVHDWVHEIAFGDTTARNAVNAGFPQLVPQGWSLGVEMMFYVSAPLLLLLGRSPVRWTIPAVGFLAYVAVTIALGLSLDTYRYASFLGSSGLFLAGAALYRFRDRIPALPRPGAAAAVGVVVLVEIFRHQFALDDRWFYAVLALEVGIVAAIVQVTVPPRLRPIDRLAGNLSYGVFVSHYLAGFCLLIVSDRLRSGADPYPIGRYGTPAFGFLTLALALVLALAAHSAVEHPVERLRDRLRGRRSDDRSAVVQTQPVPAAASGLPR